MDYNRNKKYFAESSIQPGVLAIILGIIVFMPSKFLGFIIIVAGAAYIYFKVKNRPTDEEIDSICYNEINNAVRKGLSKMGLDEEQVQLIDPIVINGPYFSNIARGHLRKKVMMVV